MKELIYDAEKHIDIKYIENILKENCEKKIICFGGGTAADILMKRLLYKHNVFCFLDNNKAIQGTQLQGKPICSPDILETLDKGKYIVLILSKHVNPISKQLEAMHLVRNTDYFDIYNKFLDYFLIKKFEEGAYKFIEFIERIPKGTFEAIEIKSNKKIGIVCIGEMIQYTTWYAMAQCLLLRYNGYKPELIIDTLKSFNSYIYFDGMEAVSRIYIDYVVMILKQKCKDIEVKYINEYEQTELLQDDIEMTKKYAPIVIKWFDSHMDEVFIPDNKSRIEIAENILKHTLKSIKTFFNKNHYETINVFTGIHKHRCLYTYIGKKMGMRVSTYDATKLGFSSYNADGISGHSCDIKKMLKENYFTEEEKQEIIRLAKQDFEKILHSPISENNDDFYQPVGYNTKKTIDSYDVVIPLNISWDSAALGIDYIFRDEIEWLEKTIKFIMENTNKTIIIREHPHQSKLKGFIHLDIEKELPILMQYKNRIMFCKSDALINTYQYIEQCKLVIPYSSTVGIEAAIMGKPVILHTNVYYAEAGIAYSAKDMSDYYNMIKQVLENEDFNMNINTNNAYQIYYYRMNKCINTMFSECFSEYFDLSIEELNNMPGIKQILGIIAENIPAVYENVKRNLNQLK